MNPVNYPPILVIDDTPAIHEDFRKTLGHQAQENASELASLDTLGSMILGQDQKLPTQRFDIHSAYQGKEGLECVVKALKAGQPYGVVFIDMRMPPGWDGIETANQIWKVDPNIQIIICTAYSDYSWSEMREKLGTNHHWLILKKPFDIIEASQLALALSEKWKLNRQVEQKVDNLQEQVKARTQQLEQSLTELKTSLEVLNLQKRAFEACNDGIIIITASHLENIITYVNPAFERITGHLAIEAVGKDCLKILSVEQNQRETTIITDGFANKKEANAELHCHRKNGDPLSIELRIAPVFDKTGNTTHFVGIIIDITERKRMLEQLAYQATHDQLTGLSNRTLLLDRIQQAIAYAKRYNLIVAVLFLDLDRFKMINDSLGHDVGDLVLKEIANRLLVMLRQYDTIARLGGDEFVVVASTLNKSEDATALAQKLLHSIREPFNIQGHELDLTCSIGISFYPQDGHDNHTLLKNADAALYCAKELGRANYQVYKNEMNEKALERLNLERDLRLALERNEFIIHYQPIVELSTNRIIGLEALIRWQHPTLGLIQPNDFIFLAEDTGLIIPIGEWVLRTACTQAKSWQTDRPNFQKIAVNISTKQFEQHDFVSKLKQILQDTQLQPRYLELELTESVIMKKTDLAIAKMQELKSFGVSIAIDDFGTGYSSLNYIKHLPIDRIKIDRSFISELTLSPEDTAVTLAIINMANQLKLSIVAEGVETKDQLDFLKTHFTDKGQGFYYSKAMPADECSKLLQQGTTSKQEAIK